MDSKRDEIVAGKSVDESLFIDEDDHSDVSDDSLSVDGFDVLTIDHQHKQEAVQRETSLRGSIMSNDGRCLVLQSRSSVSMECVPLALSRRGGLEDVLSMPIHSHRIRIYRTINVPTKYFYDPIVLFNPATISVHGSHVYFKIHMWSSQIDQLVENYLRKHLGLSKKTEEIHVQVLDFEQVRLAGSQEDGTSRFRLPERPTVYHQVGQTLMFYLICDSEEVATILASDIRRDPELFLIHQVLLECENPSSSSSSVLSTSTASTCTKFRLNLWLEDDCGTSAVIDQENRCDELEDLITDLEVRVDDKSFKLDEIIDQMKGVKKRVDDLFVKCKEYEAVNRDLQEKMEHYQRSFKDEVELGERREESINRRIRDVENSCESLKESLNVLDSFEEDLRKLHASLSSKTSSGDSESTEINQLKQMITELKTSAVSSPSKPVFSASNAVKNKIGQFITFACTEDVGGIHGSFDKGAGIFTTKTAGQYLFLFNGLFSSAGGSTHVDLCVNGLKKARSCAREQGTKQYGLLVISALLKLEVGDQVGVFLRKGILCESEGLCSRFIGIFYGV